jgi:hypothetical protein
VEHFARSITTNAVETLEIGWSDITMVNFNCCVIEVKDCSFHGKAI